MDGQTYYGEGTSKKIARVDAASTALRSFIQFKDGATLSPIKLPMTLDFTSDEHTDGKYLDGRQFPLEINVQRCM